MLPTDLTNLYLVKVWLGILQTDTTNDAVLSDIISGISSDILAELSRPIIVKTYTENLDGNGKCLLYRPNFPILNVLSLQIDGFAIPARVNVNGSGYVVAQKKIELVGYRFNRGVQNVALSYQAGYGVTGEAQTIPASTSYVLSPLSPDGVFNQDLGVTYASNGAALTATNSAPNAGQYQVQTNATTNVTTYTFNVADAGKGVSLSYGFIPSAISRAATEWTAHRYAGRKHIGQNSHSVGGDNTTYDKGLMPDSVLRIMEVYSRNYAIR